MSVISALSCEYDSENHLFRLKFSNENDQEISVNNKVKLSGITDQSERSVDITKSLSDYVICKTVNPYLNAQGDVFKIALKSETSTRTVGYVFPGSSLTGDEENVDIDFDEARQAYKFYTIKHLLKHHEWRIDDIGKELDVSDVIKSDCAYVIIFMPLVSAAKFEFNNILPSLALYGYYHFPKTAKPNVANLLTYGTDKELLTEVVSGRYLFLRNRSSLSVKDCKSIMEQSPLIKLLYEQLLVEADNPLHRFLILYQIIEYLVDRYFQDGLEVLLENRANISNYKLIEQIHDLKDTRSTITKLFQKTAFSEKIEILNILKSFILQFDGEYKKGEIGDCLYDIRNLLFHDYKSVLEAKKDGEIAGLIIQCEFLIHHLVIAIGYKEPIPEVKEAAASVA